MEKISFYKKRAKEIIYLLDNICCDITFIRDLNPVQIQIIKSGKKVKRGSGYDHNSQKKGLDTGFACMACIFRIRK